MKRIALAALFCAFASAIHAEGGLDPSFGTGGMVRLSLSPVGTGTFTSVAHQADGKIVAAGSTQFQPNNPPVILLMRFLSSGSLDTTFGTNGIAKAGLGDMTLASSMVVAPNGKILLSVTGTEGPPFERVVALFRFEKDGVLDSSFGTGGKRILAGIDGIPGLNGQDGGRIYLDPFGRILFVGSTGGPNQFGIVVSRMLEGGSPDVSFGHSGRVFLGTATSSTQNGAALLQPDGRIVIGGATNANGSFDFFATRLEEDGTLDTSFGTGGSTIVDFPPGREDILATVIPGPNGSLILCGGTSPDRAADQDFALARLTSQGTLDLSFGGTGTGLSRTSFSPSASAPLSGAVRIGSRILAFGAHYASGGSDAAFARYTLDGVLDPAFGTDGTGLLTTSFSPITKDIPTAGSVSPDGRVVIATGVFENYFNQDLGLMRLGAPCLTGFGVTAPASVCPGGEGIVTATGGGPSDTYTWRILNGTFLTNGAAPSMKFRAGSTGATSFSVTVTSGSCEANGSVTTYIDALTCAPGLGFHTIEPCRVVDTRLPESPSGGPSLNAARTRRFPVAGTCGIPSDARAVAANVTVLSATTPGALRVFAEGPPSPPSSVNSFRQGDTRATFTQLSLGENGAIRVETTQPAGTADVLVDVAGYYR